MNDALKARVAIISREASRIKPADITVAIEAQNLVNQTKAHGERIGLVVQELGQHITEDFPGSIAIGLTQGQLEHQDNGGSLPDVGVPVDHSRLLRLPAKLYAALAAARSAFLASWRAA